MSDLISRQAAIDAIGKALHKGSDPLTNDIIRGLELVIQSVPSAQPEQPEIIRCKDCKYMTEHYDTDGNVPYWTCSEWDFGTDYDGFCHYAERRTDEAD